jgi:uncharacterized protein
MKKPTSQFHYCFFLFLLLSSIAGHAQDSMSIEEYEPVSTLVTKETIIYKAKFPFIDVHNHQSQMPTQDLNKLLTEMDQLNMAVMINLSGRGFNIQRTLSGIFLGMKEPSYLVASIDNARRASPKRFLVFTNLDFKNFGEAGWTEKTVAQLERDVQVGATGLKIYKDLGLELRDTDGKRIPVDDVRLDPIWRKCGELKIPVLIHSGEPLAFFMPHDKFNERWLELKEIPSRARPADRFPSWQQVMSEQRRIFEKHPNTTFIMAHLGWLGNDLQTLSKLLQANTNVYTEIGAVIHELGRQPRAAREFFIENQDRILFGKDSWNQAEYYTIQSSAYLKLMMSTSHTTESDMRFGAFTDLTCLMKFLRNSIIKMR